MVNSTKLTDVWLYTTASGYYKPDTVTDATAGMYVSSFSITANTADVLRVEVGFRGNGPILLTS
jgi:endoglucanase Acf2